MKMKQRRRRCTTAIVRFLLLLCGSLSLLSSFSASNALEEQNNYDEYVRQVLEEEQQHYYDEYYAVNEDVHREEEEQQQQHHQSDDKSSEAMTEEERWILEQERLAQEQADRIAAERERQFQVELDRMDQEQQKKALQQKKRDHRNVQKVLRAAHRNDLYGILGMRPWNLKLPPTHIQFPFGGRNNNTHFQFTIPGITIKETSDQDIRKHFRMQAKQLHPDKNKDGRAQEAFYAVEMAAAILSDPNQRQAYDQERQRRRKELITANKQLVMATSWRMWQLSSQMAKTAHTLLGPFFTPVMILLAIII
jgi:chemotaxis protein histidine kinase CheA